MTSSPRPDVFDRHPIVVLVALTLIFYWKLAFTDQFTFLETPDLAFQDLPWYQFQARSMHQGTFPLWDPFQWCGQTVVGQMQPGAAFPLNWPIFLAPLKNGYLNLAWVHWHFVLMHLLAAFFMYALCRELGSSRFASIMAGAAFSFGGYLGTVGWPQMVHGAMWIPAVFLFLHRMVERGWGWTAVSNAALCGGTIGFSLLSGHHQAPLFTLLAFGCVYLYFAFSRGPIARYAALLAVVALFTFLVGGLQILPAYEYGSQAYRWVGPPQPVRMQEVVPYYAQYLWGIFPLSLLGTLFQKAYLVTDPFLGFISLTFALFAVVAGWERPRVKLYSVVALGAIAYSVGHYSVFHGLIYALVPLMNKARSPAHAIFVFQFAALTLAAQGIDLVFGPQRPEWERWRNRILKALVAIGLLALTLLFWLYLNLKFETNPGDQVMLASVVAFLLAALLQGLDRGHVSAGVVRVSLALLLVFELSITSYFYFAQRQDPKRALYLKELSAHPGIIEFLKAQPAPFRFDISSQTDQLANLGDWEGLESTRGYLASVSSDLYDLFGWDWGRATLLMNTVYVISKEPTRPGQREVYAEPAGWKVFRNDDAFPRAWAVHSIRVARDSSEAAALFRSRDLDLRRETVLMAGSAPAPALEACGGESRIEIVQRTLHSIRARASMPCQGLVVFGDPYFPGWQARVDGRPTTLYAPFGALRGVVVPAGEHTFEFVYRPYSVYLGGALTALGLLGCGLLAWLAQSRQRAASASR